MFRDELIAAAKKFGLDLTAEQIDRFCLFAERLVETNKVMNLTALTEPADVAVKHMIDSLSCYDAAWFPEGASVLDLGTGAGFPGLPLLIYRPDLKVTFFDSLQKRLTFLQGVTAELGLSLYGSPRHIYLLKRRPVRGRAGRSPKGPVHPRRRGGGSPPRPFAGAG